MPSTMSTSLVDADEFVAPEVQRLDHLAVHEHLHALQAVVNVHETARLMAVAPNLNLMFAGELGHDHLPAHRAGAFSRPPSHVPWRAIDVVKPRQARPHAEVLAVMPAHALANKFFQP